jgi:4,5-DOPA dioxygenase extradiol
VKEFPAFFVSHGAPTLAIEKSAASDFLVSLGRELASRGGRPRAIVVFSAHWETPVPTVGIAEAPETIHDFGGFPDELYRRRYPGRGAIETAREAMDLLADAGLPVRSDADRGLDHGAWVPLRLMIPDAGVPISQISLQPDLGPRYAYRVGEAVRPLRRDGVLIVGSGSITHNLHELRARPLGEMPHVTEFVEWINERAERGDTEGLLDYRRRAPHAARNHPTGEHLLPFFSILGVASPGERLHRVHRSTTFGSLRMDAYACAAASSAPPGP